MSLTFPALFFAIILTFSSSTPTNRFSDCDDVLDRALIEAIEHHEYQKVVDLLSRGASVNAKGINLTALETAIFEADIDIVKLLLEKGAKINSEDLTQASRGVQGDNQKSTAIVKLLLARGADVRSNGVDALAAAARADNLELVNLYLAKNVNPNGQTRGGSSVLFDVVDTGSIDSTEALLAAGADVKSIDKENGQSVLMKATRVTAGSDPAVRVRLLKMLLARGADIKATDNGGGTALHHSVQQYLSEAGGVFSYPEVVDLLLDHGAEVNAKDKRGNTALILSVRAGGVRGIPQLLLDKGADVNLANADGETPLMFAATGGYNDLVQLLLAKGAKLELKDKNGKTAIVHAVEEGQPEIVGLLANKGADLKGLPYQTENELRTATHNFALLRAVSFHRRDEVRKFLAAGADPNFRGQGGRSALLIEARYAYGDEIVKLLLEHNANVDLADNEGNTPLMLAVVGNRNEIVQLLL